MEPILYRTDDGELLQRFPNGEWRDKNHQIFYEDVNKVPFFDGKAISGKFVEKMFYSSLEEYLIDFPQAKNQGYQYYFKKKFYEEKLGGYPNSEHFLLQTFPSYQCIIGSFLAISALSEFINVKYPKWNGKPQIVVNNGDDSYVRKTFETYEQVQVAAEELKKLAPFYMNDLVDFGYEWD